MEPQTQTAAHSLLNLSTPPTKTTKSFQKPRLPPPSTLYRPPPLSIQAATTTTTTTTSTPVPLHPPLTPTTTPFYNNNKYITPSQITTTTPTTASTMTPKHHFVPFKLPPIETMTPPYSPQEYQNVRGFNGGSGSGFVGAKRRIDFGVSGKSNGVWEGRVGKQQQQQLQYHHQGNGNNGVVVKDAASCVSSVSSVSSLRGQQQQQQQVQKKKDEVKSEGMRMNMNMMMSKEDEKNKMEAQEAQVVTRAYKKVYANATPSSYCHVCSRTRKSVHFAECALIKQGLCRKVICDKCFVTFGWDWEFAKSGKWICVHCRDLCPKRAQCHIYKKINSRRGSKRGKAKCGGKKGGRGGCGKGNNGQNDHGHQHEGQQNVPEMQVQVQQASVAGNGYQDHVQRQNHVLYQQQPPQQVQSQVQYTANHQMPSYPQQATRGSMHYASYQPVAARQMPAQDPYLGMNTSYQAQPHYQTPTPTNNMTPSNYYAGNVYPTPPPLSLYPTSSTPTSAPVAVPSPSPVEMYRQPSSGDGIPPISSLMRPRHLVH